MKLQVKKIVGFWFHKVLIRDIKGYISSYVFFYIFISFFFCSVSIISLLANFINFSQEELLSGLGITSLGILLVTIAVAGFIVDIFKNRVRLLLITAVIIIVGYFLVFFEGVVQIIGVSIVILNDGIFLVNLLTIVTHETTILNRGRLIGYSFFLSFSFSSFLILITWRYLWAIIIIEIVIFILIFSLSKKYSYIETEERLKTEKKLTEIFTGSYHILGYFTSFCVLGFVLGNAFPENIEARITPFSFLIVFLVFVLIVGILLDNLGRKRSFAAGVIITASLILFEGLFISDFALYNSIFFGCAIAVIFILLFTFTADFSTERNAIKYRGRITSIFLIFLIVGFLIGLLQKYLLNLLYLSNIQYFFWLPAFIEGFSPFILIVLLVWILPLPEILSPKEADWAKSLRQLYIFNQNSVCLYPKFFTTNPQTNVPNEDLITGGLTGVLELLTEITNEHKHLRIIDKEGIKIYFAYGKYVICALLSTKFLPILFKKLDMFTKDFENTFEQELLNFRGNTYPFLNGSEKLLLKYFS